MTSGANDRSRGLTDAEGHLIEAQGLFGGAMAIAGLFVNLYLFKVGGLDAIAWYQVVDFIVITAMFVVVGYALARRSTRDAMRLGLLVLCAEYTVLLVLGDHARNVVGLLGALDGIGQGLYWAGVNVNEYVVTHRSTRALYIGRLSVWNNTVPAVSQLAAGALVSAVGALGGRGYLVLFVCMIGVFAVAFHHAGATRPLSGVAFRMRDLRHERTNPLWRLSLAQQFLRGAWTMVLAAFTSVLVYLVLRHEWAVSLFGAGTTVLAGVVGGVAGNVLHRRPTAYVLGAVVVPLGLLGFGLWTSWPGLVAYAIGIKAFDAFGKNPVDKVSYDAQEHSGQRWEETYHYFVEREIALNGGRIVGFVAVLVLLGSTHGVDAVRYCLLASALLPPLTGALQHRIEQSVHSADLPDVPPGFPDDR